jgi:hypothetical protein
MGVGGDEKESCCYHSGMKRQSLRYQRTVPSQNWTLMSTHMAACGASGFWCRGLLLDTMNEGLSRE